MDVKHFGRISGRGTHAVVSTGVALGLALLLALAPVSIGARQQFDELVVFGTSLSDPGNAFALAGGNNTPPEYEFDALLVPFLVYPRGGHHLSNGATWIEQLARTLGLVNNAQAAFRSPSRTAMNFAVAGARARVFPDNAHLAFQVGAYLGKVGGNASPDAQYFIEMGSNDVSDALFAALTGGNPTLIRQQAIGAIAGAISVLHSRGARKFVVWNAPDIALTPAVRRLSLTVPTASALATIQSTAFKNDLEAALLGLSVLPDIEIDYFDMLDLIDDVVGNKAAYGLEVVDRACVTPGDPPFTCQNPDEYLFWDGIHPTHAGHGILAEQVRALLGV
jgi:phospholipase/lecithinase/hemolysin